MARPTKHATLICAILSGIMLVGALIGVLGQFLGTAKQDVAGYQVPLGDVKVVGPALAGVCALVLLARTRGRYTKWLAINIIMAMVALAYTIDSGELKDLVGMGLN